MFFLPHVFVYLFRVYLILPENIRFVSSFERFSFLFYRNGVNAKKAYIILQIMLTYEVVVPSVL